MKTFKADLVMEDKIILEQKNLQSGFIKANYVQIISELKLWQTQLGMLVDFGLQKVKVERIPFTEKTKSALEDKIDFYDIAKIQSYLRALKLRTGIIVNFGKQGLEIRGVRA